MAYIYRTVEPNVLRLSTSEVPDAVLYKYIEHKGNSYPLTVSKVQQYCESKSLPFPWYKSKNVFLEKDLPVVEAGLLSKFYGYYTQIGKLLRISKNTATISDTYDPKYKINWLLKEAISNSEAKKSSIEALKLMVDREATPEDFPYSSEKPDFLKNTEAVIEEESTKGCTYCYKILPGVYKISNRKLSSTLLFYFTIEQKDLEIYLETVDSPAEGLLTDEKLELFKNMVEGSGAEIKYATSSVL